MVKDRRLTVFPFAGDAVSLELPVALRGLTFSSAGRKIYGIVDSYDGGKSVLASVEINTGSLTPLFSLTPFSSILGVTIDVRETTGIVSATLQRNGPRQCGLFKVDVAHGTIEHLADNVTGECGDYSSSWSGLSISPDGTQMVGTAQKGQLGIVDLKTGRVEKLWRGTAASWSPDGKWIAVLTYDEPMQISLMRADDFSVQRNLGSDKSGNLEWSPDSRYLLLWNAGFCGLGSGYIGSLEARNIQTYRRIPIRSSECKVDLMTTGWVDDDVVEIEKR